MVIKAVPFGSGFQMDEDTAARQIALVGEAQDTVDKSREAMSALGDGQTPLVWTADGKSVDLTAELKTRYESGRLWLDAISTDLAEARENIHQAIQDTLLLNDQQKAHYQNLLYRTNSTSPSGPIAV